MNTVIISGNLTRDPELRYRASGKAFCNLGIAVNRPKNDKGEVVTDFFDAVTFGAVAELCGNYLKKGSRTFIQGRLQSSSYTDKTGAKRSKVEIIADKVEFSSIEKKTKPEPVKVTQADVFLGPEVEDDDLPFF